MADKIYPKGLSVFNPKDNAPAFVLGTICITIEDLLEWVKGDGKQYLTDYKGKDQIKLSVTSLKDKRGINLTVDTWKPSGAQQQTGTAHFAPKQEKQEEFRVKDNGDLDTLPF